MANCPKCGYRLKFTDIKPECPGCGVNLLYYNHQESLMEDADKAEAEHIQMQPKIDRVKFAFIGTKLSIVRLVLLLVPIGMLFLPLASINVNMPFKTIDADVSILNLAMDVMAELDFGVLLDMISGSDVTRLAFICYILSILYVFFAAVACIVRIPATAFSCSEKSNGNDRNITITVVAIMFLVLAMVGFIIFDVQLTNAFGAMYSGNISFGAFLALASLIGAIVVEMFIKKEDAPVKYKDISEFVERVEKRNAEKAQKLEEAKQIVAEYEAEKASVVS